MAKSFKYPLYSIIASFAVLASMTGCVEEEIIPDAAEAGIPVKARLTFGTKGTDDIAVTTKAELNSYSDIISLFLFIYNEAGTVCEQVLELDSSKLSEDTQATDDDGHHYYTAEINTTTGKKRICGVANYATVQNWVDFEEKVKEYGQDAMNGKSSEEIGKSLFYLIDDYISGGKTIEFNTAQMIFTGAETISVSKDGSTDKDLKLQRIVANVEFNISNGKTSDGNTVAFRPVNYKIYNLPKGTRLSGGRVTEDNPEEARPEFYYDGVENTRITSSEKGYSFTFFMPENVQPDASAKVESAAQREEWDYENNVGAEPGEKDYTHTTENATFVVISGEYAEYDSENNLKKSGNTSYTVHLGDFSKGYRDEHPENPYGNFSVRRNYSYTYNITINGVSSITAEVETDGPGKQQGAEGSIVNIEDITRSFSLDAHFEQILLTYNLSNIANAVRNMNLTDGDADGNGINDVDEAIGNYLRLHVDTPFQDGSVDVYPYTLYSQAVSGENPATGPDAAAEAAKAEALNGKADYKWVEFYPQSSYTSLSAYPGLPLWKNDGKDINTKTDNEYLIDAYDLCVKLGKAVRKLYDKKDVSTGNNAEDGITVTEINGVYYAFFTGFVDEYYYFSDPLGKESDWIWSDFVNKDARVMMISMNVKSSDDGNSVSSNVHTYILQRSIQTFYDDTNAAGLTAFGIETFNETRLMKTGECIAYGTDDANGRKNTLAILGATSRNTDWSFFINQSQNGYLNSIGNNDDRKSRLSGTYAHDDMAYAACLSRNRDLNGNNKIDPEEVRWYLPSINEYLRIGLGGQSISGEAQLYSGDKALMKEGDYPTSYIADGALYYTSTSGKHVYWAVEKGAYGSNTDYGEGNNKGKFNIRCIRLLPSDLEGLNRQSEATFELKRKGTGYYNYNYVIDCRDKLIPSLYRTTPANYPLLPHAEEDEANRFYKGFVIARNNLSHNGTSRFNLSEVQNRDGDRYDPCSQYYSEEGTPSGSYWRVPNLTELTIMASINDVLQLTEPTGTSTQFSNMHVRRGFWFNQNQITCNVATVKKVNGNKLDAEVDANWQESPIYIRCVRDASDSELDSSQPYPGY